MEITDELYDWIYAAHKKCKQGDGRACFELGSLYSSKLQGHVDENFCKQYFKYGCKAGDGDSCLMLAYKSKSEGDEEKSTRYLDKSQQEFMRQCTQNNDARCCWLFANHILGDNNFERFPRAIQALERGCNAGDNDCCVRAGSILVSKEYPNSNIPRGLKFLETACTRKDGDGCLLYGETLAQKKDNKVNVTDFFKKACKYGSEAGCTSYGLKLMEEKKARKALNVFTKSCKRGNSEACSIAGWIQLNVQHNVEKSKEMYSESCKLGDQEACFNLQDLLNK